MIARERLAVVNKVESDIKDGMSFSFPWLSQEKTVKVIRMSLGDVIVEYITFKQLQGLTDSSIQRLKNTLNSFADFMGISFPIASVTSKHINGKNSYVEYCFNKKKPMTKASVNLELRNLKTLLKWCVESEHLNKMPKIVMVKVSKAKPNYLTEEEICSILELKTLSPKWKQIFCFYMATGMRRAEPFFGHMEGSWLVIPEEHTKGKKEKEIHLTPDMVKVWKEMMEIKSEFESRGYKLYNLFGKITKKFKWAIRESGIDDKHHLHNTRHTFAVRRYLQTGNIYGVKNELGHSSVMVTEKYAEFKQSRLESDFPSLANSIRKSRKPTLMDTNLMDTNIPLLS
jgi:site-specific recombinase XerD